MNDHSSTNVPNNTPKNRKKLWVGLAVITFLLFITWWLLPVIGAYYYNVKYNNFKPGDKMYLKDWQLNDTSVHRIGLTELALPINKDDIDKMDIDLYKKALIKKELNQSNRRQMIDSEWQIDCDSLRKYNTRSIGTYLDHEIRFFKYNGKYYSMNYYIIKPDKKALVKENYYDYQLPPGYSLTKDTVFYIPYYKVDNK